MSADGRGADRLSCDLLVIGAGMAGLTAAARAAADGAQVTVVERAPTIGGSAAVSSGYLWTAERVADLERIDPGGDRSLQRVVVEEFPSLVRFVADQGATVSDQIPVLDGVGHQVDIVGYLDRCRSTVIANGGSVVVDAEVNELVCTDGRVSGALVSDASMTVEIASDWTMLATGGFAHSPELLGEHITPWARSMRARAGAWCRGDGLRLACSVGGAPPRPNSGFYGHLIGRGVDLSDPERWDTFTLLHSRSSVLIAADGRRFTDETRGDNISAQATVAEADGRALLVWDRAIHEQYVLQSWPPGNAGVDKFEIAVKSGAVGTCAPDLSLLAEFATTQGFAGAELLRTIESFNREVATTRTDADVLRQGTHHPLTTPPFYGLVVEPAVTFPYAGIVVDEHARVVRDDGEPIGGLLSAGVDIGNVYREGYAGGLALAGAFALRALRTAGRC